MPPCWPRLASSNKHTQHSAAALTARETQHSTQTRTMATKKKPNPLKEAYKSKREALQAAGEAALGKQTTKGAVFFPRSKFKKSKATASLYVVGWGRPPRHHPRRCTPLITATTALSFVRDPLLGFARHNRVHASCTTACVCAADAWSAQGRPPIPVQYRLPQFDSIAQVRFEVSWPS